MVTEHGNDRPAKLGQLLEHVVHAVPTRLDILDQFLWFTVSVVHQLLPLHELSSSQATVVEVSH